MSAALFVPRAPGMSIYGVRTAEAVAVVTFDDGPEPNNTEAVLGELSAVCATATFFVLVCRARRHPKLLGEVIAAGHEIALHGEDHRRLTQLDAGKCTEVLRDARAELEQLGGVPVRMFRPAYGRQSSALWQGAMAADLIPVLWEIECREWTTDADPFAELDNIRRGSIILAHDSVASVEDGADPFNAPRVDRHVITAAILARVRQAGLTAVSLSRALSTGAPRWRVWLDEVGEPRA